MKRVLIFLTAIVLAPEWSFGAAAQSAVGFIEALYSVEHQPLTSRRIDFSNKEALEKFFDPDMTALFLKDFECQKKEEGICNLDFDPIYDAQDFAEKTINLKVSKVQSRPNQFKTTFTNLGTRSLIYILKNTADGWRISDIKYPKGRSLKELLSTKVN